MEHDKNQASENIDSGTSDVSSRKGYDERKVVYCILCAGSGVYEDKDCILCELIVRFSMKDQVKANEFSKDLETTLLKKVNESILKEIKRIELMEE